jgi:hypothetical protein
MGSPNHLGTTQAGQLTPRRPPKDFSPPSVRVLSVLAIGSMIKDKSAGENVLRQSDLDWTIVHASMLTDGPASGSVEVLVSMGPDGACQTRFRART